MKKIYLFSFIIFITLLMLLIFFHNQIINFSLPLIKDRIQNQLNISDNDKTKINIKTDFENKAIILNVINPYFKDSEYIKDSYASSIIVEKKINNLFDKKISKITINQLNLEFDNNEIYLDSEEEFSIDNTVSELLLNTKKFDKILIRNSNFNLFSLIDNHEIYFDELNIDNNNNEIISSGIVKNGDSNNFFQIDNSKNGLINIQINLDSYPLIFLEKMFVNNNLEIILSNKYNGKVNFVIDPDFKFFSSKYEIFSLDQKVKVSGNYTSKNNIHKSNIEINEIYLEEFLPKNNIFRLVDISQLGKSNIELNILNDFENIDFYITGSNINYIAKGKIKDNLIYNLNIKINEILLEDYLINSELFELINISEFGLFNIEINSLENFNNINFQINNFNKNFSMTGIFKDNQLYELNAKGKDIEIYKFIKNDKLKMDPDPNWIVSSLVKNNIFSFDLKYEFLEKIFDIKITDMYDNIINTNFDFVKNTIDNFEIIFFKDELNKFQFNKKDLSFIVSFNKEFRKFFIHNFDKDIFKEMGFSYIKDFDKIDFTGNVSDDYFNKLINSSDINNIITNFSFFIENVQLDISQINLINNFVKTDGPINILYEKNNILNSGKILINLDKTEMDIKKIEFSKPRDNPLELHFNYQNQLNEELLINHLLIKGKDINISGEIVFLNKIIKSVNLNSFKILDNDFKLKIDSENINNSKFNKKFKVNIDGKKIDLSFLKVNEAQSFFKDIPIKITINIKKLKYINNTDFSPAELKGDFLNVWQKLYFKGLFDSGENLNISILTNSKGRFFDINSTNAGKTLMIKKISKSIRGGSLRFSGKYESKDNNNFFDSNLSLTNFAIKKKSKLSTFIKVIRIFDIKKQLAGDTEDFEYAEMKIKKKEKIFEIIDAKAYGGLMALSANGVVDKNNDKVDIKGLVAPTYALDSWVGKIPLFGTILTGIEGGGVIAANYSVKGTVENPKYFVNPLSMLTPGIFKEFWSIFELQKPQEAN